MLIGIPFLLAALLIGMYVGTYNKFKRNDILFKGTDKILFLFIPIMVTIAHFVWAIQSLKDDKAYSLHLIKMILFKYPIVVGMLVEAILEREAFELSQDQRIVSIKKRKNRKKVIRSREPISAYEEDKSTKEFLNIYKSTLALSH